MTLTWVMWIWMTWTRMNYEFIGCARLVQFEPASPLPWMRGKLGHESYWTLLKTKTHNVSLLTSLQSFAMRRDRDLNHGRFSFALQASFLFDRLTVWMSNRIVTSLFPVQLYPLHIASELGLFAVFLPSPVVLQWCPFLSEQWLKPDKLLINGGKVADPGRSLRRGNYSRLPDAVMNALYSVSWISPAVSPVEHPYSFSPSNVTYFFFFFFFC